MIFFNIYLDSFLTNTNLHIRSLMVTNHKDPNTNQIGLDDQKFLWIDIHDWLDLVALTVSLHGEFPLFPLVILSVLILLCNSFCLFLYFIFRSQEPIVFCFVLFFETIFLCSPCCSGNHYVHSG